MKTPAAPTLASLALTLAGCNSPRFASPVLPPDAYFRSQLGRVTVVALSDSRGIRFQVPDSKADIAAEPSIFENTASAFAPVAAYERFAEKQSRGAALAEPARAVNGRIDLAPDNPGPYVPVGSLIVGAAYLCSDPTVALQAILPEFRRAYGLAFAEPAARINAARATLDAATAPVRFEAELRDRLLAELKQNAPAVALAANRAGADTILELYVYEPNVSSFSSRVTNVFAAIGEDVRPALGLSLGLRVRLLDARTGNELYYDYLDYRGPTHRFTEWAAHDAKVLNAELERSLANLSAEIIAQLFTRESNASVDRHALATVGLARRPASPVFPATPGLALPPARAVARN